jgi:hypothetical protein
MIYPVNTYIGTCLDCSLALVFANGMCFQVHPEDTAGMLIVVTLSHHTLFHYNLYVNYIYQVCVSILNNYGAGWCTAVVTCQLNIQEFKVHILCFVRTTIPSLGGLFLSLTLTLLNRILVQKQTVTQLIRMFLSFMKPKGSLPCSQNPVIGPYPKQEGSILPLPILFL